MPVPLENRNSGVDLRFVGASGGVRVFVDQAAQDGFSEDPFAVEVGHGDAGSVEFVIGDALGDALVRPVGLEYTIVEVACSRLVAA
jgi:hypothetical protein